MASSSSAQLVTPAVDFDPEESVTRRLTQIIDTFRNDWSKICGFKLLQQSMTTLLTYKVWMVLISLVTLTRGMQTPGHDVDVVRREIYCHDEEEYRHGDLCCLNCPAGYRLISPCNENRRKGKCEKCEDGTFTEHSNGLKHCFKCTQCRSDQDVVKPCSPTQNAECQCRSGGFCAPDQACEVCKKCSRCDKDEETVKNCTPTMNTLCKKTQHSPSSASETTWIVFVLIAVGGIFVVVGAVVWLCKRRATASQRNLPVGHKGGQDYSEDSLTEERRNADTQKRSCTNLLLSGQLVRTKSFTEDERQVLCESVSSSSSNSEHSLTGPPSSAFPTSAPRAGFTVPPPRRREEEEFPLLYPVNGEESLRKCFEYFEEMNVDYVKRFFRNLGMSDNEIKSRELLSHEDKIHELLNVWVEKKGREASLNDLLKALLDLNQRLTAEMVKEKAVCNAHYHL